MSDGKGWQPGILDSVDRFAQILVDNANDNDGFVLAMGEEYGIQGNMGAVAALRKIFGTIADEVMEEVAEKFGGVEPRDE